MSPRLKSEFWVASLVRRCNAQGNFATILRKGAEEAGAVYVVLLRRDGRCDFLGPAPGSSVDDEGERRFEHLNPEPCPWPEISSKILGLRKFDPDIWVVEISVDVGNASLKVVTE